MAKTSELMEQRAAQTERTTSTFFPDEPTVKMKVIFNKDDGVGNQVEAYVNGVRYTIMRGRVVDVPQLVYLALEQTGRYAIEVVR